MAAYDAVLAVGRRGQLRGCGQQPKLSSGVRRPTTAEPAPATIAIAPTAASAAAATAATATTKPTTATPAVTVLAGSSQRGHGRQDAREGHFR